MGGRQALQVKRSKWVSREKGERHQRDGEAMLSIKGVRDENKNSLNKWFRIRDSDDNDECFSISEWNFSCLHKPGDPGQFGGGSD
jgi:hypothetical protein